MRDDVRNVVALDASDGDERQGDVGNHPIKIIEGYSGANVLFGLRRVNGADPDIVRTRKPPFRTARGGRSLCRHRQAGGPARRGQGGGARGEGMSELLHSPDAELAALKARVARLERLEEQVYFQERTLSALNEAITLQQRQLDDLQGRMEAVEEKFRELWELVGNEGGEATVPPHYMKLA